MSLPGARDPRHLLAHTKKALEEDADLWVFGYASLIWRPEFESVEERPATVYGWHRSLAMRSRVNRGTPECPGLVFALVKGGSCRGKVYRVDRKRADGELNRLWVREMPTGIYDPKWLMCKTPLGTVRALAFTLDHQSPSHTGTLPDAQIIEILRTANGRFGSTLAYLMDTAHSLKSHGIRDRDIERLVRLARQHALTD